VSSGEELKKALAHSPQEVVFSGPGKTEDELELACRNAKIVTVLIDSFGELKRLSSMAALTGVKIRAGVRLTVDERGLWRKFGIPLKRLSAFFEEAKRCPQIDLCGMQFHTSWNMDASQQTAFLKRLGEILAGFDKADLKRIRFLDIGGGYWPFEGEWLQPAATPEGKLKECLESSHGFVDGLDHRCVDALPIDRFATALSEALKAYIFPHVRPVIFCEPGRWISQAGMHILLRVVDKKDDQLVITDGGIQAVGWERFEHDYFPLINLSRPALKERECLVCGSLCTPHDLWGYSYFGQSIEVGDVLLLPTQGAYTYSLRQEFIKAIPKEAFLEP
ncbi:MAG TPA: alanine racemase, partial [Candidatus Omnitrophota bacterium]|nr:alanine racemase [Candidatus Omnitrophota bacterium]